MTSLSPHFRLIQEKVYHFWVPSKIPQFHVMMRTSGNKNVELNKVKYTDRRAFVRLGDVLLISIYRQKILRNKLKAINLYLKKDFRTLLREIKEDLNIYYIHELKDSKIIKIPVLHKLIC